MSERQAALARARAARARAEAEMALRQNEVGFLGGAGRAFSTELTRNVLNIPEAMAKTAAGVAAVPRTPFPFSLIPGAINAVTGKNPQEVGMRAFLSNERILPEVTPEQAFAGIRTIGHRLGQVVTGGYDVPLSETHKGHVELENQITAKAADEAPVGTYVGDMVADGVTLFMGRLPGTLKANPQMADVAENAVKAQTTVPGAIKSVLTSGPMKKLARGTGRAVETSLEAATLTFLNDPEIKPQEAASVAAGAAAGQAIGSAGLTALSTFAKHPAKFTAGVIVMITTARQLQEFGPGQNSVYEAADEVFQNVQYGMILGAAGGIVGAGRIKPENASKAVRAITDGVTSIPRGAAISLLREAVTNDEDGMIEDVMGKVMQSPDSFTPAQIKRLERAVRSENVSIRSEIDKMMNNDDFRARVEAVGSAGATEASQVPHSD